MSRQRATIRDGLQFDTRPDSPDSDTLIDLPLQDRESVRGADPPPSRDDLPFEEPSPSSGGRGVGAGMLVIGLAAGFGAGFLVGQRVAPPAPRPSAAQVTSPAVSEPRKAPQPPASNPPVGRTLSGPPGEPDKARPTETREPDRARPTTDTQPGTLQIASRPPGAQVYVDDVRVGITPLTMINVKPGAHRVRIELPGHRPWTTSVTVDAGAQARIGASLE